MTEVTKKGLLSHFFALAAKMDFLFGYSTKKHRFTNSAKSPVLQGGDG